MNDPIEQLRRLVEARAKATTGPWRWNLNRKSKQVHLEGSPEKGAEFVMDFVRWGMGGSAPRFRTPDGLMQRADELSAAVRHREHHESWYRTIAHPDATFIALAGSIDLPAILAAWEADRATVRRMREELNGERKSIIYDPDDNIGIARKTREELDAAIAAMEQARARLAKLEKVVEAAKEKMRNDEQLWEARYEADRDEIGQLQARLAELEKVVEKLPKTKDGVTIVNGVDFVWLYHEQVGSVVKWQTRTDDVIGSGGRCYPLIHDDFTGDADWHFIVDGSGNCITKQVAMCYSTREAAIAALDKEAK